MRVLMTILLVAGLALSACGRKGALQPPPGPGEPVEERRPLF